MFSRHWILLTEVEINDSRFENYINSITYANSTDDVNLDNPSLILSKICSVNSQQTFVGLQDVFNTSSA